MILHFEGTAGESQTIVSPDAPGTLREQLAAIDAYLQIPPDERRRDRLGSWDAARWVAIPHTRRVAE